MTDNPIVGRVEFDQAHDPAYFLKEQLRIINEHSMVILEENRQLKNKLKMAVNTLKRYANPNMYEDVFSNMLLDAQFVLDDIGEGL